MDANEPNRPAKRKRLNFACNHCRSKKVRCDQQYPSCQSCLVAGIECITTDTRRPGVEVVRKPAGSQGRGPTPGLSPSPARQVELLPAVAPARSESAPNRNPSVATPDNPGPADDPPGRFAGRLPMAPRIIQSTRGYACPGLFMGIGNLLAMPLCVAIGRRPVFLMSLLVLVASGIWCACSASLSSHIAARNILSVAAGQSEALVAFMVQEIHFLHQRGRAATWNGVLQGAGTGAMFVATTYLVPAWGVRWWYGVITILNGALLISAFLLVPETMYDRVLEDDGELIDAPHSRDGKETPLSTTEVGDEERNPGYEARVARVITTANHTLDPDRWSEMWAFYKVAAQSFCIPSIVWLLLLNGAFLGVYVFHSSTFAPVLLSPPYLFRFEFLGFVQLAIIVANFIALPIIGYGSDWIIKLMSRMNKGVYQPEYRLLSLILPSIIAVVSCVIYGQTAQHPEKWS
ncbi:hypothetical protein VTI74DRAFT_921 [Chaetomium olivicolor]